MYFSNTYISSFLHLIRLFSLTVPNGDASKLQDGYGKIQDQRTSMRMLHTKTPG